MVDLIKEMPDGMDIEAGAQGFRGNAAFVDFSDDRSLLGPQLLSGLHSHGIQASESASIRSLPSVFLAGGQARCCKETRISGKVLQILPT
jgi:hypothetical protein